MLYANGMLNRIEENRVVRELLVNLDMHSPGEREHAERVSVYAVAIGAEAGMPDGDLRRLRLASVLHDVGKVRIQAQTLQSNGPLDDEALTRIRLQSALAEQILERFDFLRPTIPGIRHHHEWWDGTGSPDRLAGKSIPVDARIIAVAETYDFLTAGSPWSDPVEPTSALTEIRRLAESQFEPVVVEMLERVWARIQPPNQLP